jgi:hypothetical protein
VAVLFAVGQGHNQSMSAALQLELAAYGDLILLESKENIVHGKTVLSSPL